MRDAWLVTLVSVPIALVLWLSALLEARTGQGSVMLLMVLYAPLGLFGLKPAVAGGILLHLAYAACVDVARVGRVAPLWPVAMAFAHYLSVGVLLWASSEDVRRLSGPVSPPGLWLPAGLVVFLAWHVVLAASVRYGFPGLRRRRDGKAENVIVFGPRGARDLPRDL